MELLIPDWPAPPNVRAAMTTRRGGVSAGPYASLNLGFGADDPAHVAENRRRLREALELDQEPGWLKQVHGTTVVRLVGRQSLADTKDAAAWECRPTSTETSPEADASFATQAGVACVVQAADCLPLLLCDDEGTVVAAAHAGWRGLAAGVLEATVKALPAPPQSLMAWLGAAIGPRSFEVGAEVRDAFVARDAAAASCFAPFSKGGRAPVSEHGAGSGAGGFQSEKFLADLYALARRRLAAAGVTRVHGGGLCTFRDADRFFSYRRDGRCGRMAALVWLRQ